MDPEELKIEYRDRMLVLSGDRPAQKRDSAVRYHQVERSYGPFERKFSFPYSVCCDEIEANYKEGIIEIIVPKKPEGGAKSVPVNK